MHEASQIAWANIQWQQTKHAEQPYSIDFNDVYFNTESGLDETEHVFIAQNQLKSRFTALETDAFTIIETGFGTGLNFYCVAAHFLANAPTNAHLHFISIEKHPLKFEDMQKAAKMLNQAWPQLNAITTEISAEFLPQYAQLKAGLNQISLANNRIQLSLWVNDVLSALPQITQKADAWFLDGFAPAKNAEMWSDQVLAQLARLSKTGSTFATFTSASAVRRGLQQAGFEVNKCAGFGKKREMLCGVFN